jgi:zeaxanthin glucosyltransferase
VRRVCAGNRDTAYVWVVLLEAFGSLEDVQVVLSVGKNICPENLGRIPSNTIVVRSAPQIELLKRATICITHAGLNTVLESLAHGVPMVAIPIGCDQPGTAAQNCTSWRRRIHRAGRANNGTAEGFDRESFARSELSRAGWLFPEGDFKTRGLDVAANIIEQAFHKYQPEADGRSVARVKRKTAEDRGRVPFVAITE